MSSITTASKVRGHCMEMPVIGLGTWQSSDEEIEIAVTRAVEVGYRHFDTAYVYMNEAAIGRALKKLISDGKVKREELFITTKLPNFGNQARYVEDYLKKSLAALQMSYVDLYLVHCPVGLVHGEDFLPKDENGKVRTIETDHIAIWKVMEAQVDAGRTKAIGLSNFNKRQIHRIIQNARIPPSNLQIEFHIYLQQKELQAFCKENGVTICAYAPLGSQNLPNFLNMIGHSNEGLPQHTPLTDPVVLNIAKKHNKTAAQVLLRFALQLGIAVIPKSSNPNRIKENFQVFDYELSIGEMKSLSALDKGPKGRFFANGIFPGIETHPEYPYETPDV